MTRLLLGLADRSTVDLLCLSTSLSTLSFPIDLLFFNQFFLKIPWIFCKLSSIFLKYHLRRNVLQINYSAKNCYQCRHQYVKLYFVPRPRSYYLCPLSLSLFLFLTHIGILKNVMDFLTQGFRDVNAQQKKSWALYDLFSHLLISYNTCFKILAKIWTYLPFDYFWRRDGAAFGSQLYIVVVG